MKRLLIASIASLALAAHAAPIFKTEGPDGRPVILKLSEEPCTNDSVLGFLAIRAQPELVPKFKAAVLTYGGRDWASCWIDMGGSVYSLDEEGAVLQPVLRADFRDDSV